MIFLTSAEDPEPRPLSPLPGPPLSHCVGCRTPIFERYFLVVGEACWHSGCLRCCICQLRLDSQVTCYHREGMVFCRDDYYRKFSKRCSRCHHPVNPKDLVMRAREAVYHQQCFNCIICNSPLQTGESFALGEDGVLYCQSHYEPLLAAGAGLVHPPGDGHGGPLLIPAGSGSGGHKGRPKKRKQMMIERGLSMDSDVGNSYMMGGGGGMGGNGKTKRMRTSFKHHQLRTMKAYFALNHNPDAKDLKQLAQKTGLTKRVLQVWFQNARAKYRRAVQRPGEGISGEESIGSTSGGDKSKTDGKDDGNTQDYDAEGFDQSYCDDDDGNSVRTSFSSTPGDFDPVAAVSSLHGDQNSAPEPLAEFFQTERPLL